MPTKGAPQIRQFEGNKVAKRLFAMPRSESARMDFSRFFSPKKPASAARIGSLLLLKTNLPVTSGRVFTSIRFRY